MNGSVLLFIIPLVICLYALYQQKKNYDDYVKRKEDNHRKFNDDRSKAYWNK